MSNNFFKNRRGQIGETLTWVIATIIILVVLVFFIFGSSMLADTKGIKENFKENLFSKGTFEGDDLFMKKSIYSYILIRGDTNKKNINDFLVLEESRGNYNLDLEETKTEIRRRFDTK